MSGGIDQTARTGTDRYLHRYYRGDTFRPVKVAISLPDPLFFAAEQLAERLHVSRSQLYAQALCVYLKERHDPAVTEQLNAVYGAAASSLDPAFVAAQAQVIKHEAW